MIYIIIGQFLILFILILVLNFKQNMKLTDLEGIPISSTFPYNKLNLIEQKNYIICLSTSCPHCRKIVEEIQSLNFNTSNIYIIFSEEENVVSNYLEQYDNLNFEYLSDVLVEDVYITTTPFVYVLNENEIIINKKVIKTVASLDIV